MSLSLTIILYLFLIPWRAWLQNATSNFCDSSCTPPSTLFPIISLICDDLRVNNRITPHKIHHPALIFSWYPAHKNIFLDNRNPDLIYCVTQSIFQNSDIIDVWGLIFLCEICGTNCEYLVAEVETNVRDKHTHIINSERHVFCCW